jgi:hypothetical membrane protein
MPTFNNRLVRVGAAGYAAFAAGVVVVGALNPGYSHVREAMSALAATNARYAGLMIAGFMCLALALIATGVALWRRLSATTSGKLAGGLIIVFGLLAGVSGLARQDCSEQLPSCVDYGQGIGASTHFWVHQYVGLAGFLVLLVALFVLARAVRRTPGLTYLAVPSRIVAFLCLAVLVPMFIFGFEGYQGLVQRPTYALMFGWPLLVAGLRARP